MDFHSFFIIIVHHSQLLLHGAKTPYIEFQYLSMKLHHILQSNKSRRQENFKIFSSFSLLLLVVCVCESLIYIFYIVMIALGIFLFLKYFINLSKIYSVILIMSIKLASTFVQIDLQAVDVHSFLRNLQRINREFLLES